MGEYSREDVLSESVHPHFTLPYQCFPGITEEQLKIKKPAFFGAALKDFVCRADIGKELMKTYVEDPEKNLTIVEFDTGHWIQLEQPDKLNKELENWIKQIIG
jgi:soluble epoxide hydrolase/lipid-phosphate phosphatase